MFDSLTLSSVHVARTLGLVCSILWTTAARADHDVTVRMKNGDVVPGHLVEYVPGDHVTVDDETGSRRKIATSEVSNMNFGRASAAANPSSEPAGSAGAPVTTPANSATSASTLHLESLLEERTYWRTRNTSLAAPVALTLIGVTSMLVSVYPFLAAASDLDEAGYYGEQEERDYERRAQIKAKAGMALMFGGLAFFAGGVAAFSLRTSRRRQKHELRRIDEQLRGLGAQASITPWLTPRATAARGPSGGLAATLRF